LHFISLIRQKNFINHHVYATAGQLALADTVGLMTKIIITTLPLATNVANTLIL
jgi:hypothetical protein